MTRGRKKALDAHNLNEGKYVLIPRQLTLDLHCLNKSRNVVRRHSQCPSILKKVDAADAAQTVSVPRVRAKSMYARVAAAPVTPPPSFPTQQLQQSIQKAAPALVPVKLQGTPVSNVLHSLPTNGVQAAPSFNGSTESSTQHFSPVMYLSCTSRTHSEYYEMQWITKSIHSELEIKSNWGQRSL